MPGPAPLPATPALELAPAAPFRLAQAAAIVPGGTDVYRLNADYDKPTQIGDVCPGCDSIKSSSGR